MGRVRFQGVTVQGCVLVDSGEIFAPTRPQFACTGWLCALQFRRAEPRERQRSLAPSAPGLPESAITSVGVGERSLARAGLNQFTTRGSALVAIGHALTTARCNRS